MPDEQTFAARLGHLMDHANPEGKPYTYEEVAAGVRDRGITLSVSYLWQLRTGAKDNPRLHHIEALARFFGVPPAYFFDPAIAHEVDDELEFLRMVRRSGVRDIVMRTDRLSPKMRDAVRALLKNLEAVERGDA